ncbi:thiolase family protein [bacterium]|nr:thiolase family protein [bacterium]
MEDVVILSAARTPIGAYLGAFKDVPAPKLGAAAIAEALKRAGLDPKLVDECLMGCVLPAGQGQAPARQAAIYAGLPNTVRCTTVNKVCGSGMKTVMLAAQAIQSGDAEFIVAGGMENMSRVPFYLDKAREGYRLGNGKLIDGLIGDGLWDVYGDQHMGNCAELCSRDKKISRAEQDAFARQSYERALAAQKSGLFNAEMVAVTVPGKTPVTVSADEEPGKAKLDRFADLKPAFEKEGTVTAANASSLNDGAAALVLASASAAKRLGLKPIARLVAQASHAQAPEWFTTAPIGATEKLLKRAGLTAKDIDLFEINEAFSVVALACMQGLEIDDKRVNTRGGAVALGHPIGASGARILTTLIHALHHDKKKRGVASICIGGGEATAVLIEAMG